MCQLINAILISVFSIVNSSIPNYVELLNTETNKWNEWVKNSGKYDGWRSQNIPPNAQLVYGLCALQGGSRDNWLRSPFVRRDEALSIKIEISFTMRSCKSRPEQRLNCEDTLYLMIYESDSPSDVPSSWNDRIYTRVAIISPDITWTDMRQDENIVNVKTYSVEPRRAGFFIALRDIGACAMVKLIRIYYIACPTITHLFARYSRLVVSHDFRIRNVEGICVDGAELINLDKHPQLICQPTGQWHISNFMFCHCKPGYTSLESKMVCIKCPHNTFKSSRGSEKCVYCPKHSYSDTGADKCTCNEGLFPIKSSTDLISCAEPLLSPRNLNGNFTETGQLNLSWDASHIIDPSINNENSYKVHFKITCISCKDSEQLFFTPGPDVSQSSVLIDALESGITYKFSVTSMSSISHLMNFSSANPSSASISIDTKPADQSCQLSNLFVRKSQNKRSLLISWSLVSEDSMKINSYQVIIYKSSTDTGQSKLIILDSQMQNVKTSFYEFPYDKNPINSYRIKVRARSKSAWGPFVFSKKIDLRDLVKQKTYEEDIDDSNTYLSSQNKLMIISVFGMGLILMLIAIPLCFYCRYLTNRSMKNRKKNNVSKTFSTSLDVANYSQIHAGSSTTRVYIDPSNYEDPSTIVQEFAHEIDPEKIHIETVIGEGEFGEVCRGRLIKHDHRHKIPVAIKTLKSGCSEKERMNFLMEAAIMGQFSHSNIIQLEGIVTKTEPIMIITQFIEFGSLDTFLRKKKYQFSTLQLLGMLKGIVSGMKYLSEMRYVHRDLAARNILVDKDLCCKVSDFGLSREIEADNTEGAYTTKGGLIPIRWTAPEAINYRRFTSSSDVWSFGIVMWEVMSYGERPYWNWPNKDVLQSIESGYRLPAPKRCPPAIHLLMLDCWTYERSERPKFGQILHSVDALLMCPEALASIPLSHSIGRLSVDSYRRSSSIVSESKKAHLNSKPLLQSEPVFGPESLIAHWLDCLDLPRYKDNFVKHHLIYLCHICKFSRNDLISLEITDSEHLQKLMSNIEAMQNYFDSLQSASFAVL